MTAVAQQRHPATRNAPTLFGFRGAGAKEFPRRAAEAILVTGVMVLLGCSTTAPVGCCNCSSQSLNTRLCSARNSSSVESTRKRFSEPGLLDHDDRVNVNDPDVHLTGTSALALAFARAHGDAIARIKNVVGHSPDGGRLAAVGTGYAVSRCLVLTANHVITSYPYDKRTGRVIDSDYAAYSGVNPVGRKVHLCFGARGKAKDVRCDISETGTVIGSGENYNSEHIPSVVYDWALLKLDHRLPKYVQPMTISLADYQYYGRKRFPIAVLGYSADLSAITHRVDLYQSSTNCREIGAGPDNSVALSCFTSHGDSGGPALVYMPDPKTGIPKWFAWGIAVKMASNKVRRHKGTNLQFGRTLVANINDFVDPFNKVSAPDFEAYPDCTIPAK